jgi:two-component system CitB family sensor kinase
MLRRGMSTARPLRKHVAGLDLSQQVFILYAAIVVLVIGTGVVVAAIAADRLVRRGAEERVRSVASAVASMPTVADAIGRPDPSAELQPLAEQMRQKADVSFVVIMAPDRTRFSHPNPEMIGGAFIGTIQPALDGDVVIESFEGSLGPSVRAVVPVYGSEEDETPVGLVAAGVTVDQIGGPLGDVAPLLLGGAALTLVVAGAGSWWISRRLARQTFGMGAAELARVYAHHDAVLHGIREGLLVVDEDRTVVLINDAAQHLLDVGPEVQGRPVDELPVTGVLAELFASGRSVEDETHLAGERLVVVSQAPVGDTEATSSDAELGTVVTLRDHTQVMALADELSTTRSLADALRAQAHESANRLHTIVMLVELGDIDAAVRLATGEVRATKALTNRLVGQFDEPTLVALLLGKAAEAARRSVELVITDDSRLIGEPMEPVDLVTIVGNFVDNAIDAALAGEPPRRVEVTIRTEDEDLLVQVRDSGRGFEPEALARVFEPGWSTKPTEVDRRHGRGIGMALVSQVVTRCGGMVEVANADPDQTDLGGAVVEARLPLPPEGREGRNGEATADQDADATSQPS